MGARPGREGLAILPPPLSVYGPGTKWLSIVLHISYNSWSRGLDFLLCTERSWCLTRFQTHPPPLVKLFCKLFKSTYFIEFSIDEFGMSSVALADFGQWSLPHFPIHHLRTRTRTRRVLSTGRLHSDGL